MNKPIILNLFQDIALERADGPRPASPHAVEGLFRKLLGKEAIKKREQIGNSKEPKDGHGSPQKVIKDLARLRDEFGCNLAFDPSRAAALRSLLASLGLGRDEIALCMKNSTDSNGLIDLGKLCREIDHLISSRSEKGAGLAMNRRYFPLLALAFLRLGADPQGIKSAFEKYAMSRSDVGLKDISSMIFDLAPGTKLSPEETRKLLERLGINVQATDLKEDSSSLGIVKLISSLSPSTRSKYKLHIKELLAQALEEKGVSPDKVKKILEGLDIKSFKGIKETGQGNGSISEEQLRTLIEGLKIKPSNDRQALVDKRQVLSRLHPFREAVKQKEIRAGAQDSAYESKDQVKESHLVKGKTIVCLVQKSETGNKKGRLNREGNIAYPLGVERTFNLDRGMLEPIETANVKWVHGNEAIAKILEHLKSMFLKGSQESRIALHPPELGQMDLRVLVKRGHLQVQLSAEHPWAKEIVETNLNTLRQQLLQAGYVVDRLEVSVGLGGNGYAAQSGGDGSRQGNFTFSRKPEEGQMVRVQDIRAVGEVIDTEHQVSIMV